MRPPASKVAREAPSRPTLASDGRTTIVPPVEIRARTSQVRRGQHVGRDGDARAPDAQNQQERVGQTRDRRRDGLPAVLHVDESSRIPLGGLGGRARVRPAAAVLRPRLVLQDELHVGEGAVGDADDERRLAGASADSTSRGPVGDRRLEARRRVPTPASKSTTGLARARDLRGLGSHRRRGRDDADPSAEEPAATTRPVLI